MADFSHHHVIEMSIISSLQRRRLPLDREPDCQLSTAIDDDDFSVSPVSTDHDGSVQSTLSAGSTSDGRCSSDPDCSSASVDGATVYSSCSCISSKCATDSFDSTTCISSDGIPIKSSLLATTTTKATTDASSEPREEADPSKLSEGLATSQAAIF